MLQGLDMGGPAASLGDPHGAELPVRSQQRGKFATPLSEPFDALDDLLGNDFAGGPDDPADLPTFVGRAVRERG